MTALGGGAGRLRARPGRAGAVLTAALMALAGCGGSSTPAPGPTPAPSSTQSTVTSAASAATASAAVPRASPRATVAMRPCAAQCTGQIAGATYGIVLPKSWNGTLLLYSHGYRFAAPVPPANAPVQTFAQVSTTDTDGTGRDALSAKLLAEGYALAGSAYRSNGWAVADGVKAGEDLHARFVAVVGRPTRTYVWGDSLGGLVTELLSEKHGGDWVDGAAPMCGVVAGPVLNFDLAFDVAYAVKTLLDPTLKLTGYTSAKEAGDNWTAAVRAVAKAAADPAGGGTAKILLIAALIDAPTQTATFDGADLISQVKARVETMVTALSFSTSARFEIERRVGGNPSGNAATSYAARVDATERAFIGGVGGNVGQLTAALDRGRRVTADPTARRAFEALGDPSGALRVPTLSMHTEADPLVVVQNESVLAERVRSAKASADLVQLFIKAPSSYPESTGAPYGAGHCVFTDAQRVDLIDTLDAWVRTGVRPSPPGLVARFGAGLDPGYAVGGWPAGS